MSTLASTSPAAARPRIPRRLRYLYAAFGLLLLWLVLWLAPVDVRTFPATWNIGLDDAIGRMQSWVIGARNVNPFFVYVIDPDSGRHRRPAARWKICWSAPWPAVLIVLFAVAYRAAGRRAAIVATAGVFVMACSASGPPPCRRWRSWAWRWPLRSCSASRWASSPRSRTGCSGSSARCWTPCRPCPPSSTSSRWCSSSAWRVPAVIATVIYALPPAVRMTDLGIRHVRRDVLEAADAYGSTRRQKLVKVQLPLAHAVDSGGRQPDDHDGAGHRGHRRLIDRPGWGWRSTRRCSGSRWATASSGAGHRARGRHLRPHCRGRDVGERSPGSSPAPTVAPPGTPTGA
ncbi:MAG: ABC transporter permease subunit [Caldilineaceae bacterium]